MATTPIYGFETPDDTDLVKDGALAIRTALDDVDTTLGTALNSNDYAGMVLIKKQTIGTGVSTVVINDAFNTNFENYRIFISGGVASTNTLINAYLGGAPVAGYYYAGTLTPYAGGATSQIAFANATSLNRIGFGTTAVLQADLDLQNPFTAKNTIIKVNFLSNLTTGDTGTVMGFLNNTTSYTSFTVGASSGTMTGGTIYVYGYGAS
jgi:hypothetical protein